MSRMRVGMGVLVAVGIALLVQAWGDADPSRPLAGPEAAARAPSETASGAGTSEGVASPARVTLDDAGRKERHRADVSLQPGAAVPSLSRLEHDIGEALADQGEVYFQMEGEELVGLYVRRVRAGSRFEAMAIEAGDVITHFNGLALDSPNDAKRAVPAILEGSGFHVVVRRDGRSLHFHSRWD